MKLKPGSCRAFTVYELLIVVVILGILAGALALPALEGQRSDRNCGQQTKCVNNLKQLGIAFFLTQGDLASTNAAYVIQLSAAEGGAPNAVNIQCTTDGGMSPYTYQIFGIMSNDINTPKLVVCPADERPAHTNLNIVRNNAGSDPSQLVNQYVSYFIGRDVNERHPRMMLSGDRNIGYSEIGPVGAYGFSPVPFANFGFAKEFGTNALNGRAQWTLKMHDKSGNVLFADGHVESLTSAKLRETMKNSGDPKSTGHLGNFLLFP